MTAFRKKEGYFANCKVCEKPMFLSDLEAHVHKVHSLSPEDYYLSYILQVEERPRCSCPKCKSYCQFISIRSGYSSYCSISCNRKSASLQFS